MIKDLRLIELELFSYCNRRCNWCPNREVDRHSKNIELDNDILIKLLEELQSGGFKGAITFSRFNEPMSHTDILKDKISLIKSYLPHVKLVSNTNGDYITEENLNGLLIGELTIMDYDNKGLDKCIKRLEKANVTIDKVDYPYIHGYYDKMEILYVVDWEKFWLITDRGGILSEFSSNIRKNPCHQPQYFVGINYDGTVSSCCNVRNDIDALKPFVMGDLHEKSLYSILNTTRCILFKNHCMFGQFEEGSPCYTCQNIAGRYISDNPSIQYGEEYKTGGNE